MIWTTTTLGDFSPLTYGKGLPKKARRSGEVKVFGSNGPVGRHDTALVNEPGVIVGRKGSVGEVHYSSDPFWPIDTSYYITAGKNRCVHFTYYLLKHLGLQRLSGDSAVPGLNRDTAHRQEVYVPDLRTQKRIASTLGSFDKLIENNRRRIEILEEMARLLYREWFVHFRFPGHEDVELVDSYLGRIPEGWAAVRLASACSLVMGQSPKSEYYNDIGEGLPFHQGVSDFGPRFPTHTKWTTVDKRVAEPGDILFSVRAPVGRINVASDRLVVGRGLSAIRALDGFQYFLLLQLKDQFSVEDSIGGGTIFNAVTKKDMESIHLLKPIPFVLEEFEKIVTPMADLVANLTRQNVSLREARALLLPRLVSGELDVSELDLELAEV